MASVSCKGAQQPQAVRGELLHLLCHISKQNKTIFKELLNINMDGIGHVMRPHRAAGGLLRPPLLHQPFTE